MSGGSMNYLYRKLLWESDFEDTTELRKEFRMHLVVVAAALKAIEWVDSGDMSPGDEDEAIDQVLGSTSRGQRMRDSGYTRRPTLREMKEPEPVAHVKVHPLQGNESQRKVEITWVGGPSAGPLYANPPRIEQEPVSWGIDWSNPSCCTIIKQHPDGVKEVVAVEYSPPRVWKSITPDEIYEMYNEPRSDSEMVEFARSVEAKLKERNHG